ncbi:uncharacterized protein LOC144175991 isoform X1 [Haemaphysalis longicornis]
MKAVLALTLFAVVGLAYAQDDICSLPAESRASFVHCHLSEEALENFALIRREFQCEDLDCVLTKVCELSADTHDGCRRAVQLRTGHGANLRDLEGFQSDPISTSLSTQRHLYSPAA